MTALLPAVLRAAEEDVINRDENIIVEAASSDVDYRTNTGVFRDVVISQGDIVVRAQRAQSNGLDFENSQWTFDGGVDIQVQNRGSLRSEDAVVTFRNNRIAMATITGNPAEFEQKRTDSDQLARGRAREIEYEVSEGVVRLSNDAWLTDGRNEIKGSRLIYNIRDQKWQAMSDPDDGERVRFTIVPKSKDDEQSRTP